MFESIREALRDLWHGSRTPEERRAALAQMRETLVRARVGVEDLQAARSTTKVRLAEERRELDTVRRRKEMAERIGDAETVAVAGRFERQHAERVDVLERKLAAQEEELALVEREVTEMTREFKAAHAGIDPATVAGGGSDRARQAEAEAEVDAALGGSGPGGEELDALRRREAREHRDAQADAMLRALKQRLGRDE